MSRTLAIVLLIPCLHVFADRTTLADPPSVIADFEDYKKTVPTYGVILLNETLDKVLLVRSYWGRRWGFPKGKVNEGERGHECAAREALEEIGFNLDSMLDPDTWINEVELEV